jgi:hypothetical protein
MSERRARSGRQTIVRVARGDRTPLPAIVVCLVLAGAAPASAAAPPYRSSVERLDAATKDAMTGVSWHRGCPVPLHDLRDVHVTFWGFDRDAHRGELIVHRRWAADLTHVFRRLYRTRFAIRRMRPVDRYGGHDRRSMAADNTSAFNCRFVAGTSTWSQHAYGRAVDIDPVENPYVSGNHVSPRAGRRFADRSLDRRGMIHRRDLVWRAFHGIGWGWGGTWRAAQDYQHFSSTGT